MTPLAPLNLLASFLTFSRLPLVRFPSPFSHSHRLSATAPFVAGRPAAEADRWQRADLDSIAREITHIEKKKAVEAKALKKAEEARARGEASAKLDTELSNIAETIDRCSQSTPVRKRTLR